MVSGQRQGINMSSEVVVAAMASELAAFRKGGAGRRRLLETGIRGENSASVLRSFLAKHPAQMVWNIGFAGALSPMLKVGDLVIDPEMNRFTETFLHRAEALQKEGFSVYFGKSIASQQILWKYADKTALARSVPFGTVAWTDMESAAVGGVCLEQRLPLFTVRCISDLLHEDLPLDLNRCFDSNGSLRFLKLSGEILAHPRAVVGLFELHKRARLCSEKLASFVTRMDSLASLT
jgi:hypothetical protein